MRGNSIKSHQKPFLFQSLNPNRFSLQPQYSFAKNLTAKPQLHSSGAKGLAIQHAFPDSFLFFQGGEERFEFQLLPFSKIFQHQKTSFPQSFFPTFHFYKNTPTHLEKPQTNEWKKNPIKKHKVQKQKGYHLTRSITLPIPLQFSTLFGRVLAPPACPPVAIANVKTKIASSCPISSSSACLIEPFVPCSIRAGAATPFC